MHFTYQQPEGELQQGDLLRISDDLKSVLEEYHPYFANHDDYKFFMVLTQSCDLVRRSEKQCKSRYITIAAVRPAETVVYRELSRYQRTELERNAGICTLEARSKVWSFLEKLINNRQPDYFYLEPDHDVEIYQPLVVCMSLSVALKAPEHYIKCLEARSGQLRPLFQAKLGWLVGNSFSRVGVPDWTPHYATDENFKRKIDTWLQELYVWTEKRALSYVARKWKELKTTHGAEYLISEAEVYEALNEFASLKKSRRKDFCDKIVTHVNDILSQVSEEELTRLSTRLMNAPNLTPYIKT